MRIVVADDHPIFRDGLCAIVRRAFEHSEIIEASNWQEVVAACSGAEPDLFILDLMFPGLDMDASIPGLRSEFPDSYIVVISMLNDRDIIDKVLNAGADGFIGKDIAPDDVVAALVAIRNGGFIVKISNSALVAPTAKPALNLTARQSEVLGLLVMGKSNKEIARLLGISPFTVRIHVSSLFRLLGVTTRSGAAVKGMEMLNPRGGTEQSV